MIKINLNNTMKAIKIVSIAFLLLIAFSSYSAVVVIDQSGYRFSPSDVSVNVGDVIRWVWSSDSHTTTSITVPAGAATWDSPLTSSNTTFEYTVTVAGSYSYKCIPHESMGMVGSFTASVASGINDFDLSKVILVFPNPAKSFINLKTSTNGQVLISDVLGKRIKSYQLSDLPSMEDSYRIELSDLAGGVYVISFLPPDNKKRVSIKFIKE